MIEGTLYRGRIRIMNEITEPKWVNISDNYLWSVSVTRDGVTEIYPFSTYQKAYIFYEKQKEELNRHAGWR